MGQRIFIANPAVREQVPLLIGLVSPSGGGKTFSALRLATGIQRVYGGPIVLIDTENKRALHYADAFKFLHVPFAPPFGADDYKAAIRYAAARKPCCIIVDSLSHEHVGEGGLLDSHEKILDRMAGDDWNKREKSSMAAWAKVKPLRTALIEDIKQISGAMIFCWRGQEKMKPMRTSSGKIEIVPQGLCAIGSKELIYEMTVNCLLPARSNGVPDWEGTDPGERLEMKLPIQFRNLFSPGTVLSEDVGQAMAEWACGGIRPQPVAAPRTPAEAPPIHPPADAGVTSPPISGDEMALRSRLEGELTAAARMGRAEFIARWKLGRHQWQDLPATKRYFIDLRDMLLAIADEADQRSPLNASDPKANSEPLPHSNPGEMSDGDETHLS